MRERAARGATAVAKRRDADDARLRPRHSGAADAGARARPACSWAARWCCSSGAAWRREVERASASASACSQHRPLPSSRSSPSSSAMVRARRRPADGPIALDNFRWMMDVVILLGTIGAIALSIDDNDRAGIDDGRVARADPARVVGHDAARRGARPDDRLPRHRADVDLGVRAGRHQSPQRAVGRGRAQVLPARRVLDGVPAVRHRARLRRDGQRPASTRSATRVAAQPSRRRVRSCSSASRCCSSASASRSRRCRSTCGRPTSTTARRIPITAYMAATVKTAAFAAFLRVWLEAFP